MCSDLRRAGQGIGGLILTACAVLVMAGDVFGQELFPNGYAYRRTITADADLVGGTGNLSNFPMLVSGTISSLKTVGNGGRVQNANGYDIIFTSDANGATVLSHEVEVWEPTTGQIAAWVKVPTLSGSTDTPIYMFYGNASVTTSQENKTAVWDGNYKMVQHWSPRSIESGAIMVTDFQTPASHPNDAGTFWAWTNPASYNNGSYTYIGGINYSCSLPTGWCDQFSVMANGYIWAPTAGTYYFGTDSDDASDIILNGSVVASWYGGHGTCNCWNYNGARTLGVGWHRLIYRMQENGGGEAWRMAWVRPGGGWEWPAASNYGYMADSTANNRDGFSYNNVNQEGSGIVGGGYGFDGGDDFVRVNFNMPEVNFTMEAWVRTDRDCGIMGVNQGTHGGNYDRGLWINNGALNCYVWQGSSWATSSSGLNNNQWHHIALTCQSGVGQKAYVDGQLVGTNAYDHSDFNWEDRLELGYTNSKGFFYGSMDEPRISDTVRSGDWIATQHANIASPGTFYAMSGEELPNQPPTSFSLLTPANTSTVDVNQPTFAWEAASDPEGTATVMYTLQVDTDSGFAAPLYREYAGLTATSATLQPADKLPDGLFYWRVIASDGSTTRTSTEVFSLNVLANPVAPELLNPCLGSWVNVRTPRFTWAASSDPQGQPLYYYISIDNNADMSSPFVNLAPSTGGATGLTYTYSGASIANGGTYYWQVTASDGVDSTASAIGSFSVDTSLPASAIRHYRSSDFAAGTFSFTEDVGSGSTPRIQAVQNLPFGYGNGHDGSTTISGDPNSRVSCSGSSGGTTLTTGLDAAAEDIILIHQTRGTGAGQWELNKVVSDNGSTLTLASPLSYTYTEDGGASQAQAVLVPQYGNLTISGGGPASWNGDTGGIYAVMARGTVTVSGTISAAGNAGTNASCDCEVGAGVGVGFRGGSGDQRNNDNGGQGAAGEGTGGASTNSTYPIGSGNGGGAGVGKAAATGAGGGNGSAGGNGVNNGGGGSTIGIGGYVAGNAALTSMVFGGGGGGATDNPNNNIGSGGAGGGIVVIIAPTVNVNGAITVRGGNGGGGKWGGGGGAGGSVLIKGRTLTLGTNRIDATGGNPGYASSGNGGGGGVGRVRLEALSGGISGDSSPGASTAILPYQGSSTYTSAPLHIAGAESLGPIYWTQTGTGTIRFRTRTASSVAGLGSAAWSDYLTASGSPIDSPPGKYLQYEANLLSDGVNTPALTSVTILYNVPLLPTRLRPADNTTIETAQPVLRWDSATDPQGRTLYYTVTLDDNSDLSSPIVNNQATGGGGTETFYAYAGPALSDGGIYYWRVRVFDGVGHGASAVLKFEIDAGFSDWAVVHEVSSEFVAGTWTDVMDVGTGGLTAIRLSTDLPFDFGDGHDGVATISGDPNARASCAGSANSMTLTSALGPAVGDLLLIHQTRGTGAGQWELNKVAGVAGSTITLVNPLQYTYSEDGGTSQAQAILVPQYSDLTINGGGPGSWGGDVGGLYAVMCNGPIRVNGTISAAGNAGTNQSCDCTVPAGVGTGFRGGTGDQIGDDGTGQGAAGEGTGGASAGSTYPIGGGNGGGAGVGKAAATGAGGGNGSAGGNGVNNGGSGATIGIGGYVAGNTGLTSMVFGGGGGGGTDNRNNNIGSGGAGGGIVVLIGSSVTVNGGVTVRGGNGGGGKWAGGGGAGGSVLIKARSAAIGTNLINAAGGDPGYGSAGNGGAGGVGRIRVETLPSSFSGSTSGPSASVANIGLKTSGTYLSPAIPITGCSVFGPMTWQVSGSGTVGVQTRTSADGSTWSGWSAVAASGDTVASTPDDYIQYQLTLNDTGTGTPIISGVTIHYNSIIPPTITVPPANLGVCTGDTAEFGVTAHAGFGTASYQWQKDGFDLGNGGRISGADTDTLQIVNAQPADAGSYACVVTNEVGTVTSDAATLTVNAALSIDQAGPLQLVVARNSVCPDVNNELSVSATDPESDSITWSVKAGFEPTLGTVSFISGPVGSTATVCYAPAPGAAGLDDFVLVADDGCPANQDEILIEVVISDQPTVESWSSVRTHGAVGEIGLALPAEGLMSEPRRGGLQRLRVLFTIPVEPANGTLSVSDVSVTGSVGGPFTASGIALLNGGNALQLDFPPSTFPDRSVVTIDLSGAVRAVGGGLPLSGDTAVQVRMFEGDINNSGSVNLTDVGVVKLYNRQPLTPENARFDLNSDGKLNLIDAAMARSLYGG